MKHTEKIAPVAAALSAVATLACCLPIAFAAGSAMAAVAVLAGTYRWWFIAASVGLLGVGAAQLLHARLACRSRSGPSTELLLASAAIVALVLFFPQVVAGLLADWMP